MPAGLSTLTEDEKQIGATVIDMGGGTTSIAVFLEGHLVHADVVPMGGFAVTSDIARMLAAPLARRRAHQDPVRRGDGRDGWRRRRVVSVAQMGEDGDDAALRVPRSMLTRIIQARLEEIFGEVQTRLRASGFDVAAGRRAVLTGGACQLAGTRELAARILNKQVRIGRPQAFPGPGGRIGRPGLCHRHRPADGRRDHAARTFESGYRPWATGPEKKGKLARPVDPQVALMIQQYNSESVGNSGVPQGDRNISQASAKAGATTDEENLIWRST